MVIVGVWILAFTIMLTDWMKDIADIHPGFTSPVTRVTIVIIGMVAGVGLLLMGTLETFGLL